MIRAYEGGGNKARNVTLGSPGRLSATGLLSTVPTLSRLFLPGVCSLAVWCHWARGSSALFL